MAEGDPVLACGLYRTTRPSPEHPEQLGAGLLVQVHNHPDEGPPVVHLPASNTSNRWVFASHPFALNDASYVASLVALRGEGFYRMREHFHPDDSRVVAENALVQLGYTRRAEPILFFPRLDTETNALLFPGKGSKISPAVYALLEPLDVAGPRTPRRLH